MTHAPIDYIDSNQCNISYLRNVYISRDVRNTVILTCAMWHCFQAFKGWWCESASVYKYQNLKNCNCGLTMYLLRWPHHLCTSYTFIKHAVSVLNKIQIN